ncbi:MAG: competence/damage-inducible protein A [Alphaproteobacteria bacterium]
MKTSAAILVIGDEILSGRTKEANIGFIAPKLFSLGIDLQEARIIGDDIANIAAVLRAWHKSYDYIFTSGGIGPTHDDKTAEAVALAFDLPLSLHPIAAARLQQHYQPADLNEARMKMAHTPHGAILIDNPVSIAPGFIVKNVFTLPGVPKILQAMWDFVEPQLQGGEPKQAVTITTDLGEGIFATPLGEIANNFPELSIGSYPYFRLGTSGVSLVVRGTDTVKIAEAVEKITLMLKKLHGSATIIQ